MSQEGRTAFDDAFKDGVEKAEFKFDPSNWEKFAQQLDRQERQRKLGWWKVAAGVVGLVGVGALALVLSMHQPVAKTPTKSATLPIKEEAVQPTVKIREGEVDNKNALEKNIAVKGNEGVAGGKSHIAEDKSPSLENKSINGSGIRVESKNAANQKPVRDLEAGLITPKNSGNSKPVEYLLEPKAVGFLAPAIGLSEQVKVVAENVPNSIWIPVQPKWLFSGFMGLNAQSDANLSPVVGILAERRINKRFSVSAGIGYSNRSETDGDTKTFSTVYTPSNSFGYTTHILSIATDKLHYLLVPVLFNYNKGRNSFCTGFTFYKLFDSNNTIKTYDLSYGEVSNLKVSKGNGYYNGYYEFNTDLTIGYERKILPDLAMGFKLNYGLSPLKNPNYFDGDHDEDDTGKPIKNFSAHLTLRYTFYRKY